MVPHEERPEPLAQGAAAHDPQVSPGLPGESPRSDVAELAVAQAVLLEIHRALAGDGLAKRAIGDRLACVPRIVAAINRRRGSPLDAESAKDVMQDAVLRVWSKLDSFSGKGVFEIWVYQFCLFEFLNHVRRRARRGESLTLEGIDVADPSIRDDHAEAYAEVLAAVDDLGPPESTIIRLRHHDGLGFAEIGPLVDLLPTTARTRYYRALSRLRGKLTTVIAGFVS